ncbi:MAG: lipopolysaccharide biosynthesis protein [Acidimicrobiia bacterium]
MDDLNAGTGADTEQPPEHGDLRKRALGGLVWSFVQSWGGRAVTTALFLVLGRVLGPSVLGLAAYATLFVEFGRVLVDQGFSQTIVQREKVDDLDLDTAFWSAAALGAILAAASLVLAPWIAELFDRPAMTPLLRWLSLNFVLASLGSTHLGLLQRELRFRVLAIQRLVATAVGGVVGVIMAVTHHGVWSLVAMQLVTTGVGTAILLVTSGWKPRMRFSPRRLRLMAGFGLNVMGLQLLDFLHTNGDNFIIGLMLGDTVLGYYVMAYRIYTVTLEVLGTAVASVAFPTFSRLAGDRVRLRRAYLESCRLTSTLAFPVFAGIAAVAPEITEIAFGPKFAPAAPMMRVLALIALTYVAGWFMRSLLLAVGRAGMQLWASVIFVVFKLAIFAAFAKHGGVTRALIAQLVIGLLFFPIDKWMLNAGGVGYLDHLKQFMRPLIACGAMVAAVALWRQTVAADWDVVLRLLTSGVVGVVAYGVALLLIGRSALLEIRQNLKTFLGRGGDDDSSSGANDDNVVLA